MKFQCKFDTDLSTTVPKKQFAKMVYLVRKLLESYNYFFHEVKGEAEQKKVVLPDAYITFPPSSDPRSAKFLFMGNPPLLITIILGGYLVMIKYGPKLMGPRKPFELKSILLAYNFAQIFLNAALCVYVSEAIIFSSQITLVANESVDFTRERTGSLLRRNLISHANR